MLMGQGCGGSHMGDHCGVITHGGFDTVAGGAGGGRIGIL